MDGYDISGDEAERRRLSRSDAARKQGARRWLNRGSRPPLAFERRELDRRRHASSGSSVAGSSSAGASSSRLTPAKSEPEELRPRAVKLEADAPSSSRPMRRRVEA